MQPRVFVSSTYYDLKYVRDRIELFLKRFSFEPVLFESDSVTFEHNKPLDSSCYEEVKLCHMFILIVGGRYGSPSSGHKHDEFEKRYEDEFVSITRKEYETALKNDMPSFVFIDKSVFAEYLTFKKNQTFFEKLTKDKKDKKSEIKEFTFAHVDNQNIFYFIDTLQQKAIKQFDTVDEIEDYLSSQFSGMFFLYLKQLQEKASNTKILDTISELNSVVNRMNTMVDGIGKEVIKDKGELEEINRKQFKVIVENFIGIFFKSGVIDFIKKDSFQFDTPEKEKEVAKILLESIFNTPTSAEFYQKNRKTDDRTEENKRFLKSVLIQNLNSKFELSGIGLTIIDIDLDSIYPRYFKDIHPFVINNPQNMEILKTELENIVFWTFL